MFESLNIVLYLASIIAIGLSVYLVKTIGKGILNVIFVSFGFSIFFISAAMLFALLHDTGIYLLSEPTYRIWWHSLVYLGLISLIWGGYRIKHIVSTNSLVGLNKKDAIFFGILFLIMIGIILSAPLLENQLSGLFAITFIDKFGLHHLTTFILAAIAGWYLFYIKGKWGLFGVSILCMVGFVLLIGSQHFWEAITETFPIIVLNDKVIETVEVLFLIPAMSFAAFGLWRIIAYIKSLK